MRTVSLSSEPNIQPLPTIKLATLERDTISVEESERRLTKLINDHFHSKK